MPKFTIKQIKSKLSKYLDVSKKLDEGIPLSDDWYSLGSFLNLNNQISYSDIIEDLNYKKGFLLITSKDSPVLNDLKEHYRVEYINRLWFSAHRYVVFSKD